MQASHPRPPQTHAEHLAEYVLERLAEGLARAEPGTELPSDTPLAVQAARQCNLLQLRIAALHIALQRLMGALAGDAFESRLVALLELPHDYLIGQHCRSIAEARMCVAAEAAARQAQPEQVAA